MPAQASVSLTARKEICIFIKYIMISVAEETCVAVLRIWSEQAVGRTYNGTEPQ